MKITAIHAWQVYDSRGFPTVEAEVELDDGSRGSAIAPSGASTGQYEAVELRDGDPKRWRGKSVLKAVANVHQLIAPALHGRDAADQRAVDWRLIDLDSTPNKSRLGTNATLPVSMAVARAVAMARRLPLFESLESAAGPACLLPVPEIQIVGGGLHAGSRIDVQDYMVIAVGATRCDQSLEIVHNVYHAAADLLRERQQLCGVADEGGFWPVFDSNEAPLALIMEAIVAAGYIPGTDAAIALDIAATHFYDPVHRSYRFARDRRELDSAGVIAMLVDWCERYPIVSIEDPLADTDWTGWQAMTAELGGRIQLVGDDLFTTQVDRIKTGLEKGAANAVLIKLNQAGTVSETLEAISATQAAGWQPIVSARSGETEDVFIAHLAVATNAGQIKVGSFSRSERMAKWNELLRIERRLGKHARFRSFGRS